MDASAYFRGKKITVMGLGLLGRGVGDVRYLVELGAELIVTDLKTKEDLAPSLEELRNFPNITFVLGEHRLEDFKDRDLVLKGPKTPFDSLYTAEAKKNGIPVTMSTALFARFAREAGATIVGITGTRGKTTTTEMVAHILRGAGKKVLLGGNIRGVSTLALLPDVTAETVAVLELDSWQLQGFGIEKISPNIAVFTNLYPDHQDYYPDMDSYLGDKAEIFLHQESTDTLVLGEGIAEKIQQAYASKLHSHIVVANPGALEDGELAVPGAHNRANAVCALAACEAFSIPFQTGRELLWTFKGVPGRLELIREKDSVRFYNDTTATTPEATIAALNALDIGEKNIVLIMGGFDKGLDMSALIAEIPARAKRVLMLAGTGTNRILPELPDASVFADLKGAFEEAVRYANPGDIVLLSPAFASFGMFKNEYDRGDAFAALVRAL